jgi:bifunctional pyridoxal-dependent enzyme with beta-cystathionase and maltose regulon repressor activities
MLCAPRKNGRFKLKSASLEGERATVVVEVPMLPGMDALVGDQAIQVPHVVVRGESRWRVDLHETERALRDDPMHCLVFADPDDSSEEWWGDGDHS